MPAPFAVWLSRAKMLSMSHLSITPHATPDPYTDPQLWQLSRRAAQDDQLLGIIGSCSSWQIPAVLGATSTGRDFLAELDAYDRRQRRGAAGGALGVPSWTEDPTPVIESLRDLMRLPDDAAPASSSLAA